MTRAAWALIPCILLQLAWHRSQSQSGGASIQAALDHALRGTQASAAVIDLRGGSEIASSGSPRRATPGSTLKPLLLEYALDHGLTTPEVSVLCHRDLRIGTQRLACSHPSGEDVFTAQTALAASCNTYFAALARRYSPQALSQALDRSQISHRPLDAATPDELALVVLGLRGVNTTPFELARAYRSLVLAMPPGGPVARGLVDSVDYGMANPAAVKGAEIMGKTGTAANPGEGWTHGWFVGVLPGRLVIVLLVPRGDGGTAARLARQFFIHLPLDKVAR